MNKQKITTFLFSLALFTFIAISVPHLAWVFHSFEADGTGNSAVNIAWWVLSYCEALSIDVLIFWLTIIQTTEHPARAGTVWTFTFLLCLWSWYLNYLYTIAHAETGGAMWNRPLFGTPITAAVLTPFIVSALPLFILCYKYIQSMLEHGTESIEALAARVEDLQKRKGYEQQLVELTGGKLARTIERGALNGIGTAKNIWKGIRENAEQVNTEQPAVHLVEQEQGTEQEQVNIEKKVEQQDKTPAQKKQPSKDSVQLEQVRSILHEQPGLSVRKLAKQLNVPPSTANNWMKRAKETPAIQNGHGQEPITDELVPVIVK